MQRLVTLAMQRDEGELATAFYRDEGLARTPVVLGADGNFLCAKDLRLPKASDLAIFEQLVEGISDLAAYGFRLPDRLLLSDAREVLDDLAVDIEVDESGYLERPPELPSIVEHAAARHRTSGASFWEPFLSWVLTRFGSDLEELRRQRILPTGTVELSDSQAKLFFPPMRRAATSNEEANAPHAVDDEGDELAAIDKNVASLLKFFDDLAIKVRTGVARDYTPLAQKLAPNAGGGLVNRPRQADLINDTLIPALRELAEDSEKALALLHQALLWLVAMPSKSRKTVLVDELLVPVRGHGESWAWVKPGQAYFSDGWLEDRNIGLLAKAFGGRPNSQLISWERFEKKVSQFSGGSDRSWWVQRMKEIGVWDCPRVIRTGERLAVMKADYYSHLTLLQGVKCPTPCVDSVWQLYLSEISSRPARTKSGYEFYLRDVSWIDGLEDPSIRDCVVEAMLRRADRYNVYASTTLARWSDEDSSDVPSVWLYALQSENWQVIPTSDGSRNACDAWFLPLDARSSRADRFEFLPCVKAEFSSARELLRRLGVVTLEEADVPRLVRALHELAGKISGTGPEALRHISALGHDIYEAIQLRLKAGASSETLAGIHGSAGAFGGTFKKCVNEKGGVAFRLEA